MSGAREQAGTRVTSCPSAPPEPGSLLIGVVTAPGQVAYLNPPVPATAELIESFTTAGVPVENRLRFSAPCMEHRCVQWNAETGGGRCGLADRALEKLAITDGPEALPHCGIRATCRWYAQHKRSACAACPEVIRKPAEA